MTDTTPERYSPFEVAPASRSRRVLRDTVSVGVVLAAMVIAFLVTRDTPEATATTEHVHAAPPGGSGAAAPVSIDAEGARRIGITFDEAREGPMPVAVRSLGQVAWDETRTSAIAPKVDGWVESLHVDFTGQEVQAGQPLLEIYSPMLVTAQEELLLAARLAGDVAGGTEEARRSADEMLASARRRLQYWDISAADIERVERSGKASRTFTLRARSRGVVVEKLVVAGQRIMAGETLYRLADLSRVWVDAQVFEHDLALVRLGQRASVEIQAYPGERWNGTIGYVYPLVDAATRTARVRVELPNPNQRLKPGMFATVHLTSMLRDHVLSVPRSAVLSTGERSIVFVRTPSGALEPRQVVTGATSEDRVEILSGLVAGDPVVASATFLIDAESNLQSALGSMGGTGTPAAASKAAPPQHGPGHKE